MPFWLELGSEVLINKIRPATEIRVFLSVEPLGSEVSELEVNLLLSPCAASATHTDLRRLLSELQLSAEDERERQLKDGRLGVPGCSG